jgi:hypothetical protein
VGDCVRGIPGRVGSSAEETIQSLLAGGGELSVGDACLFEGAIARMLEGVAIEKAREASDGDVTVYNPEVR